VATNIRDDRVVHPARIAEYDRLRGSVGPALHLTAWGIPGLIGLITGFTVAAPWTPLAVAAGLAFMAIGVALWSSAAKRIDAQLAAISIDLWPLRAMQKVDEAEVSNEALWLAAHVGPKGGAAPAPGSPAEDIDVVLHGLHDLLGARRR